MKKANIQKLGIRLNVKIPKRPIYYDHAIYTHFCEAIRLFYFLQHNVQKPENFKVYWV